MSDADIDRIVFEVMKRVHAADAESLAERFTELAIKYPYEWAGMDRGVLTRAKTRDELMEKLDYSYTAAVMFLDPHAEPATI